MSIGSIFSFCTNRCNVESDIQQSNKNKEKNTILETDDVNLESEIKISPPPSEIMSKYKNILNHVNHINPREHTLILYPPNLNKAKSTRENKFLNKLDSNSQIKSEITPKLSNFKFDINSFKESPSLKTIFKTIDYRIDSTQNESEFNNNKVIKSSLIKQNVVNVEFLSKFNSYSKWKNSSKIFHADSFQIKRVKKIFLSEDFDNNISESSKKENIPSIIENKPNKINSISIKRNYKFFGKKPTTLSVGAQMKKSIPRIKLLEEIKRNSENYKSSISTTKIQQTKTNNQQSETRISLKESLVKSKSNLNNSESIKNEIYTKPIKSLNKTNSQTIKKINLNIKVRNF